jgi:branched-chain amino acid transport system substrate-binding protein
MRASFSSLLPALFLPLAACSFTTATGFDECTQTSDCADGRVCSAEHYCVQVDCQEVHGATDDPNAIAIGAVIPFTAPDGTQDQSERQDFNASVLALEEVNQRGIGNRQLALYACDTASDDTKLASELDYLLGQKKVVALLTSGSSQTLTAVKKTVPAGVVVMTADATSPEIAATSAQGTAPSGAPVRMLWRTAPSDSIQGQVIAQAILSGGASYQSGGDSYLSGVTRVGILYVDDPYGQGLSEVVATALGTGVTVDREQYARGGDTSAAVSALNDFDPDLTVAIGFPDDLVKILNQADGLSNLSPAAGHRWFFTDAAKDPTLLTVTDPAQLEGALGSTPAQGAGPAYASFASRFKTRFDVDPSQYSFTGHYYDAMYLLALGGAHAVGPAPDYSGQVTGAAIAEGLGMVSSGTSYQLVPSDFTAASAELESGASIDVDGASGHLQFDPSTGEAPSPIEIWRVSGGNFTTVTAVEPTVRTRPAPRR